MSLYHNKDDKFGDLNIIYKKVEKECSEVERLQKLENTDGRFLLICKQLVKRPQEYEKK